MGGYHWVPFAPPPPPSPTPSLLPDAVDVSTYLLPERKNPVPLSPPSHPPHWVKKHDKTAGRLHKRKRKACKSRKLMCGSTCVWYCNMLKFGFAAIDRPGGKGSQGFIGGAGAVSGAQLRSSQGRAVAHQEGPHWNHHRSVFDNLAVRHDLLFTEPRQAC